MNAPRPSRRRLMRSHDDRIVAGVAGGLGRQLGVDPVLVRIAFLALVFAGGFGAIMYGLLWATVPVADEGERLPTRPATTQQAVALGLIVLGLLLLLRGLGLWFSDGIVIPVILAATGSAIVWARSDEDSRARWAAPSTNGSQFPLLLDGQVSPVRIVIGVVLIAAAMAAFLAANDAIEALWGLGLAVIAALAGALLLFGPWLYRLTQQLTVERRERIRQEERAEVAAHLHDSVLQTLALIQRGASDPQHTAALARRQERELRAWLYGREHAGADGVTLAGAMRRLTDDIEANHQVTVEAVVVGDASLDDRMHALLAAIREACVNAAKHAGVGHIDVYLEVDDRAVTAFVRDRGTGFDVSSIADDRHGIRQSIIARIERHGGRASVVSTRGEGTEVEVQLPHTAVPTPTEEHP